MTRSAESITIELDDRDGVWAPSTNEIFFGRGDTCWTPERVRIWFAETSPPKRVLDRLFGPSSPMALSTALAVPAMRYAVRDGLLLPQWTAFSLADRDALATRLLPEECHLEMGRNAIFMHFHEARPLLLRQPLGLVRCTDNLDDGVHWYVDGLSEFERKPELFVPASYDTA